MRYVAQLIGIPLLTGFVVSRVLADPVLNFSLRNNPDAFELTDTQKVEGAQVGPCGAGCVAVKGLAQQRPCGSVGRGCGQSRPPYVRNCRECTHAASKLTRAPGGCRHQRPRLGREGSDAHCGRRPGWDGRAQAVHLEETRLRLDMAIGRAPPMTELQLFEHLAEYAYEVRPALRLPT